MVGYAIPMTGGGTLPVYAGVQRQMGGSIFSTIKRFAIPLLKKLMPHPFKAGQSVARLGSGVVSDLVSGGNVKANLKRRGREEINKLGRQYIDENIIQSGDGKRRRKSINKMKSRRKLDPLTYLGVRKNAVKHRLSMHKKRVGTL